MINIDLTEDLAQAANKLTLLSERQISFAVANAMTATVRAAQEQVRKQIASPSGPIEGGATAWTQRGLVSTWARPSRLVAEVGFRTDGPNAAGNYLKPLIEGGRPVSKRIDRRVSGGRIGVALVPSRGTALNRYGNVPYSILGQAVEAGRRTLGGRYFIAPVKKGSTTLAVYERKDRFIGRTSTIDNSIQRLFVLDPSPKARRKTLPIHAMLRTQVDRVFPGELSTSIRNELRRAGFR